DTTRDLPPELGRGPDRRSVGTDHRSADSAERAVHIGMGVGSDDERTGNDVPLFDHDLMADAGAGGEEVDTVLAGEGFNGAVFFLVLVTLVLNVVVEGEDRLSRLEEFFGVNRLEILRAPGPCCVV